jgi:hypothetical protein
MLQPLVLLSHHFFFNLLTGLRLLLHLFSLFLFLGFSLLRLDHLFHRIVFEVLLLLLNMEVVLLLPFLLLHIVNISLHFIFKVFLIMFNVRLELVLDCPVLGLPEHLLFLLQSLPLHLQRQILLVPLFLDHYVIRSLLRLVNLLPSLHGG